MSRRGEAIGKHAFSDRVGDGQNNLTHRFLFLHAALRDCPFSSEVAGAERTLTHRRFRKRRKHQSLNIDSNERQSLSGWCTWTKRLTHHYPLYALPFIA